ncbi:MAG: carboxypeptidase regulatory-like domain-containing protein [Pyrinomonadaceae bacterium]
MRFTNRRIAVFLTALCLLTALATSIAAQTGTSSIRGTVADPQGNIVAGASVTLTSTTKAFTRTQVTNSDGLYVFTAVPPDTYSISVEASGFKKAVVSDVQALVDTPKTVDIAMEVGQVTETVTVSGAGEAPINTTDASLGNTFTSQQVIQLPLSARNTPDLLSLQPGVAPDGAVNGGRSDQANVTLDGVDVNEQQGGRAFFSVLRVTPEALQEFRVTTTNAGAEFGRSSGAQVSLITRSGSNNFNGSLYLYYRPKTWLQANDFFNNLAGVPVTPRERRNYGGSFLGPIKKDKLFFSFFYERFEENTAVGVTREVPLPSLGQGLVKYIVSGAIPAGPCQPTVSGNVATLTAAQINTCYSAVNGVAPGVNPAALALLATAAQRYPANSTGAGDGLNTSGFRFNAPTPKRWNSATTRIDWKPTGSQEVFARYQYQFDNDQNAARFPDTPAPKTWKHPQGLAAGHTWTINSKMVNKFTYGLTRDAFTVGGDSTQNFFSFRFIFQPFNYSRTLSRVTPVHNFADDFSWVIGNHTISAGANVRLISNQRTSFGASFDTATTNPSFYDCSGDVVLFDADTCSSSIFPSVAAGSQTDLRDALTAVIGRFSQYGVNLQYAKSGSLQAPGTGVARNFKTEEYEWYVQDAWKMFPNLQVNYGLRWSTSTPVYEANGVQVKPTSSLSDFFDRRVAGMESAQPYNALISVDLAGKANNRSGYYSQDWNNFAPAVSAAWSPNFKNRFLKTIFGDNNKSVIRGGFRMTYDRIGSALAVAFDLNSTLGYSSSKSVSANTYNVSDRLGPLFTGLGQNYRTLPNITIPPTISFPLQTPPDEDLRIEQSLDDKLTTPYHYNWNVSYGRELWKGIAVEASYVGSLGRKLLVSRDVAHFNNLKDPTSGQTFYSVMRQLLDYRAVNTPITAIPNIAWFNRFVPGLAGTYNVCGVATPLTATQAAYRRVARATVNSAGATCLGGRNTNDYTFVQLLWDDGLGFGNNIFIHPQYATFAAYSTAGDSVYNALQLSFRKRFEEGLSFDVNYTYSHSIDTASGNESSGAISSGASLILNPLNLQENRGSSDFDVRHLINANFIYELPFGKGRRFFSGANRWANFFIGGWQLTGIYRWNTGFPIGEPFDDSRWATNWNVQSNGVRIRPLESSPTKNGVNGLPNIFSDPTYAYQSFRNAYPGEAGDRNYLREPNYVTFDAGVYKSFGITEKQKITFRLEVFNVTNTQRLTSVASFGMRLDPYLPASRPQSNFGQLTAIQGEPRVVQFALRYDF